MCPVRLNPLQVTCTVDRVYRPLDAAWADPVASSDCNCPCRWTFNFAESRRSILKKVLDRMAVFQESTKQLSEVVPPIVNENAMPAKPTTDHRKISLFTN